MNGIDFDLNSLLMTDEEWEKSKMSTNGDYNWSEMLNLIEYSTYEYKCSDGNMVSNKNH